MIDIVKISLISLIKVDLQHTFLRQKTRHLKSIVKSNLPKLW